MNATHHQSKSPADEVNFWRSLVQKIKADLVIAEAAVSGSEARRREHALAASLGDHEAKKRLESVLDDDRRAERELQDSKLALQQAQVELRNAENAQRAAHLEFRKAEQIRLAKARVEVARKIDAAMASFSSSWAEYSDIGRALYAISDDYPNQIYLAEHLDGLLRLAAALPHQPFYDLRHKHSYAQLGGGQPLAISESMFWRLPAAEDAAA
jgi:hypothetical protein